jgi:hypothetical protein
MTEPAPDPRAVLLDTITTAINRAGYWLAIEGRRAIADAVLAAAEQQRVRAEIAEARTRELHAVLDEVLRQFVHKGHPGEPCLQTSWISERTVQRWRDTLHNPKEQP